MRSISSYVHDAAFKTFRASTLRRSRFHDEKGQFALRSFADIRDCTSSLGSTALRISVGYRSRRPWIATNAFRHLRARLSKEARVFEWGSGTSTVWYSRRCSEVHSVEDDQFWFERIKEKAPAAYMYHLRGDAYVNKICEFPLRYFDLISIDGSQRLACFRVAQDRLKVGGTLLIDNTDKDRDTHGDHYQIDQLLDATQNWAIHRFTGWAPGIFFPQETTICTQL